MDNISLIEKCKSGDRDAFGQLYKTCLPMMKETVKHYIQDRDTVWDILHDGFLIAFTSIGSLKNESKIESWLATIMKNLSLQYLKEQSKRNHIPINDTSIVESDCEPDGTQRELSWNELDMLVEKLPEGYGKVFRLAVLDGLSHKEISELIGIAPHSSSSQLTHAKALMRRMIKQYWLEIGVLCIVGFIMLIWQGLFKQEDKPAPSPTISRNDGKGTGVETDSIVKPDSNIDSVAPDKIMIYKSFRNIETHKDIAEATIIADSISAVTKDSITNDTIQRIPEIKIKEQRIAEVNTSGIRRTENPDWSLSFTYTGALGQSGMNRYRIPDPDITDVEGPEEEIEVSEKTRNYMPLSLGLSVNKPLSSRWSIETGLRYTFLRSDMRSESEIEIKETMQRIHYIGVPLKFNYSIFTGNGFSLYGQGGVALDIPVQGTQNIWEFSPKTDKSKKGLFHIHAPLQWSAEGGIGIQYHITPSFSIYSEPSLRYYFDPGAGIRTIHQQKPFEFTVPIGLRITW